MVRMFERFNLQTDLGNTKAMICTVGFILGQQVAESYSWRATGEEPTFREREITRVTYEVCRENGRLFSATSYGEKKW